MKHALGMLFESTRTELASRTVFLLLLYKIQTQPSSPLDVLLHPKGQSVTSENFREHPAKLSGCVHACIRCTSLIGHCAFV